jgi:hypothetical protein
MRCRRSLVSDRDSMLPRHTALTRIPRSVSSSVATRVSAETRELRGDARRIPAVAKHAVDRGDVHDRATLGQVPPAGTDVEERTGEVELDDPAEPVAEVSTDGRSSEGSHSAMLATAGRTRSDESPNART